VGWTKLLFFFKGGRTALLRVGGVGSRVGEPLARHHLTNLPSLLPTTLDPVRPLDVQLAASVPRHEGLSKGGVLDRRVMELLHLVGIHPSRRNDYPHNFRAGCVSAP